MAADEAEEGEKIELDKAEEQIEEKKAKELSDRHEKPGWQWLLGWPIWRRTDPSQDCGEEEGRGAR